MLKGMLRFGTVMVLTACATTAHEPLESGDVKFCLTLCTEGGRHPGESFEECFNECLDHRVQAADEVKSAKSAPQ